MFRRRDPVPFWDRAREWLSPRKGWARGFEYLGRRMQRLPDTPHRIALGLACGLQASFTPFFGFHFVTAWTFAFILRGNMLAAATGTFMGNPLTFPFIATVAIYMGNLFLDIPIQPSGDGPTLGWLWENFDAIFLPYLIGGILPGLVASTICYCLTRPIVAAYQNRRRIKLMARAKERMKHAAAARREKKAERDAAKSAARLGKPEAEA
ncbi:MAG: DUF2062 domain-containing protein [Pseudomonadota bacterium]